MKTIKDLKNLFKRNIEEQTEKFRQLAGLRKELEETKTEAERAALEGDYNKYHELQEAARKLDDQIYVIDTHAKNVLKLNAVNADEVEEAWAEYEKAYNKRFAAAVDTYHKHRAELFKEFSALVDMQNEAIAERNECGLLIGLQDDESAIAEKFRMSYIADEAGVVSIPSQGGGEIQSRLQLGRVLLNQPDALYFAAVNEATRADLERFITSIKRHKHY